MMEERPPITQLSHYHIVSKLGAGGMGEVYLAEDTRLNRRVALKLLPAGLMRDAETLRRFLQEARAASALNHPNIVTLHDVGADEAGRFIVMELVEGQTLRGKVTADNSAETVIALGSQIAKALAAAHAAGITHRDIKPDNIMVREDGIVKVLDFGLARLTHRDLGSEPTQTSETIPGMLMGTLKYMSPEQAQGATANSPSDIFSLGIILYELATGKHPFHSESPLGYLHAIPSLQPAAPSQVKPSVPLVLEGLILRMLEKQSTKRPSAAEVVQALEAIERGGNDPTVRTTLPELTAASVSKSVFAAAPPAVDEGFWVAVLPFRYRENSRGGELGPLADGLTEDILTGLARFSYLRVIARGSTLRYANETADVRTVGKELGARYVLEGSLRLAGSALRVAVQLVDAASGANIWAETYSRDFHPANIFDLQDDLAPRIVSTIADTSGVLTHTISEALRSKSPEQLSPHEAVLRTFSYYERATPDEHAEVRAALEMAVERAPDQADCWAVLSMLYQDEHRLGFNPRPDPLNRALAAARRAVEAAPSNSLAHHVLASTLFWRREFGAFRSAAERAVALNPMDGTTVAYMGCLLAFSGEWDRGREWWEQALPLNPYHPGWFWLGPYFDAYRQGDYGGALEAAVKVNMPGYYFAQAALAAAHAQLGAEPAAGKALRQFLALRPDIASEPALARAEFGKWFGPGEVLDGFLDGLRKAGLEGALLISAGARQAAAQPGCLRHILMHRMS